MQESLNQAVESTEVVAEEPISQETNLEENTQEAETEEQVEQLDGEIDSEDAQELEDEVEEDTPFPKKAKNALERRDKKINKLRARIAELEAAQSQPQMQQYEDVVEDNPYGLKEPKEDDFDDYAEYLEAKGEYKAQREFAKRELEFKQRQEVESQQQWVQQRVSQIDKRAAETVKAIPELNGLFQENQDIIEGYSDDTKMAFLEADKPELAFYALAKEGKLESLEGMSPTRVAREIALAEMRGEQMAQSRPVSNAPQPISKPKASSPKRRTLEDMSPSELIKHINDRKRK